MANTETEQAPAGAANTQGAADMQKMILDILTEAREALDHWHDQIAPWIVSIRLLFELVGVNAEVLFDTGNQGLLIRVPNMPDVRITVVDGQAVCPFRWLGVKTHRQTLQWIAARLIRSAWPA